MFYATTDIFKPPTTCTEIPYIHILARNFSFQLMIITFIFDVFIFMPCNLTNPQCYPLVVQIILECRQR